MTIEEVVVTDKIEVLEMGQIQVRQATRVIKGGDILATSFHRHALEPGDDLKDQDQKVKNIANAVWTEEVLAAWTKLKTDQAAKLKADTVQPQG